MSNRCKKIEIVVRGNSEDDVDTSLEEAYRLIREGYYIGYDSNDTGAFYFSVSDDVPQKDHPA